jgi:thiamine pyrophosphokinase
VIPLKRCIIITAYQSNGRLTDSTVIRPDDFVICADAGFFHALKNGILPGLVIGDFDSGDFKTIEHALEDPALSGCRSIRVAAEKDDTDTMICLKYGIDEGYEEFFILGGLGGRLDHTIANLQTMCYAVEHGKAIWFLDGNNRATLRDPGKLTIDRLDDNKISLFAFGEACGGVSISGVKYPLSDHLLKNNFPLGVSNEFLEKKAEISHTTGMLLIILSHD